ncbi:MAG TPA: tetratricopeptide repeat protein [Candidatus Hydrogenedentes bacterium]|nr:tetratricopeptide repeat protein [Candidatus Hydrogenedentota bacterium]HPG67224.1 tetratricopeptide repeat protein [Candidatus Hydrogenedentota bacterium]
MNRHLALVPVIVALAVLAGLALTLPQRWGEDRIDSAPELLRVGASDATVVWRSEEAYRGEVICRRVPPKGPPMRVAEEAGDARLHEVVLRGLDAGAGYTYRVGSTGSDHAFQTQPSAVGAFTFLIVWGEVTRHLDTWLLTETPAFLVSLLPIPREGEDPFAGVRPTSPVFDPSGPNSRLLAGEAEFAATSANWALDWAGLHLGFVNDPYDLQGVLDSPSAHTVGLVLPANPFHGVPEADAVRGSGVHQAVLTHNVQSPASPAAFVLVAANVTVELVVDDVRYVFLATTHPGGLRVGVAPESASAVSLDDAHEFALREPPLGERRTCAACKRLADQGAYRESIKAYEEFIASHEGHYQVDDAYYAIAEVYEERLFDYPKAIEGYRALLDGYPESALAPLAKQRVAFLEGNADHHFKPLAAFEQIRSVTLPAAGDDPARREAALSEVRALIADYPDAAVAPVAQYWLANQCRLEEPDRAIAEYRILAERYPGDPRARDVPIEIATTLYGAGRFREAEFAFQDAMAALPDKADAIAPQRARASRNARRRTLALVAWCFVGLVVLASVALRPRGLPRWRIERGGIAFVVLAAVLAAGAWLIHEQFTSPREMFALILGLSASAAVAYPCTATLAQKILGRRAHPWRAAILGTVIALAVGVAGGYITLFYVNEHLLVIFRL